jgi:Na+-driven multidrug efflux pump
MSVKRIGQMADALFLCVFIILRVFMKSASVFDEQHFYRTLFALVIPITIQQVVTASLVMFLGPLGALGAGGMIFVSASGIVTLFHVSPEVRSLAVNIFSVISCLYWIKIFNCIAAISIFRGGDTIYALYWDVGPTWLLGVPLTLLSGFVWKLLIYWVFALSYAEEVARMLLALQRIYSKKWIHNLSEV